MVWRPWIKGEKEGDNGCNHDSVAFLMAFISLSQWEHLTRHQSERLAIIWRNTGCLEYMTLFHTISKGPFFLTLKTILICYHFDTTFFLYNYGLAYFFLLLLNTVLFILGFVLRTESEASYRLYTCHTHYKWTIFPNIVSSVIGMSMHRCTTQCRVGIALLLAHITYLEQQAIFKSYVSDN